MSLADQPAFPLHGGVPTGGRYANGDKEYSEGIPGMTYRQWLVGMALQGLLANVSIMRAAATVEENGLAMAKTLVDCATQAADAAIKAQEK